MPFHHCVGTTVRTLTLTLFATTAGLLTASMAQAADAPAKAPPPARTEAQATAAGVLPPLLSGAGAPAPAPPQRLA